MKKKEVEEEEGKPDPLLQLVTTFNRGATTERAGTTFEDELYMAYAEIMSKYVIIVLYNILQLIRSLQNIT